MSIVKMTCEYLENPLLVDEERPRFAWITSRRQAAFQIIVSGPSGVMWNSGKTISAQSVHIEYDGKPLLPFTCYSWAVTVWHTGGQKSTACAFFRTGAMNTNAWTAKWISRRYNGPVYFNKVFELARVPENATLYASALGLYQLEINGRKIDNSYFNPGWTDYRQRIQYQSYDVRSLLTEGQNSIRAVVADGWYCGNIAIAGREMYGSYPLFFFAELHLDQKRLITDETWMASEGPLRSSDLQSGDEIDYRIAFDWHPVDTIRTDLTARLSPHIGPPIRDKMQLEAKAAGTHGNALLFDMGQNFAGWVKIRTKGARGQKLSVRYGEMLNADGSLYTENLRTARQQDCFFLRGEDEEWLEPMFTYHGFRYVEITGAPDLTEQDIVGVCLYADLEETMMFTCSDPAISQLYRNTLWSQRSNFFSVPTDCPQRDERMGWTGDIAVFCRSACYNMDCSVYFEKYLRDMKDARRDGRAITDVVPDVFLPNGNYLVGAGNPVWGDAVFILPYTMFHMYGNKRAVERNYPMMESYMEYLADASDGLIRIGNHYGDWLSVGEETSKELVGTAYYANAAKLMAEMAELLGKSESVRRYEDLFNRIRQAFRARFLCDNGTLEGDSQTAYLLALHFGLLWGEERKKAVNSLIQNIRKHDYHLTTGFVGVSMLLPVLCDAGEIQTALRLLNQDTYPSWLYPIRNGATTIWERWNSYTYENGFGDAGMNSFNHYSLGSVVEWLYSYAAGIRMTHNGDGTPNITVQPLLESFPQLEATYHSMYGPITVSWAGSNLSVIVPAAQTAELLLPNGKVYRVSGAQRFVLD